METNLEDIKIEVEHETLHNLNITRKWALFIAIVGFILMGLIILIGLIAGIFLSAFKTDRANTGIPGVLMILIFLVLGVIYFFPVLFLFRFSKYTSMAVQTLDKLELARAVKNLKYYFVYVGGLIILGITLYVGALIVTGASIAFLKGMG